MQAEVMISETMKSIWVLMLRSTESQTEASNVMDGFMRVNRLASEYVKEMYGPAAIEVNGRFYTPDCEVVRAKMTADERRAKILRERSA